MISIDETEGPGVDQELIELIKGWGYMFTTEAQRLALRAGVAGDTSLVISTPTSSGKTLVGEIAVLQAIKANRRSMYLVSHKALAEQKFEDFTKRFVNPQSRISGTIGLSTGDREEGDLHADVLITTYEKALVLILSEQVDPSQYTIIADELQILGEDSRGPNIEILCTILAQRGTKQFIALTATIGNPHDIADWLECELVRSEFREVPLDQEIWFSGQGYEIEFGQHSGSDINGVLPSDVIGASNNLLDRGLGPVLVFVESRPEASRYAAEFSRQRQTTSTGISLVEQFELFTEPSERSTDLRNTTERGVAFHSADLMPAERRIIEEGFLSASFDICFATSTLAAGVNFPFRSVVFPKLTYQYGPRKNSRLSRNDYRNMSGRAGRLGLHERGLAVLLAKDQAELRHANNLVLPENDNIFSKLSELSMRQAVLTLVSTGIADDENNLFAFFEGTYFWHLTLERNPVKLDEVRNDALDAIEWLANSALIEKSEKMFFPTPLGQATARSGLLPQSATAFVSLLEEHFEDLNLRFDNSIPGLLHWICSSEEFIGDSPTRFLPYPSGGTTPGSFAYVSKNLMFRQLDRTNGRLIQNVHALHLFVEGERERLINRATHITSGNLHRLAIDVSWIIDGLHLISTVPELHCSQLISNQLAMLSRRVRWGSPTEALDLIRIANKARVPGFGRQRAMLLIEKGIIGFDDVAKAGLSSLEEILGNRVRAEALLSAVSEYSEVTAGRLSAIHDRLAEKLGLGNEMTRCKEDMGTAYESAIVALLRKHDAWLVSIVDDGIRKNVPDILLQVGTRSALIEMKTTSKQSQLIKKDDAFAVLQKAMDFDENLKRITLGKPHFDELSKENAISSIIEVTLVEHSCFIEAVLRVLCGTITAEDFMDWVSEPGLAEFERIPGKRTDLLL